MIGLAGFADFAGIVVGGTIVWAKPAGFAFDAVVSARCINGVGPATRRAGAAPVTRRGAEVRVVATAGAREAVAVAEILVGSAVARDRADALSPGRVHDRAALRALFARRLADLVLVEVEWARSAVFGLVAELAVWTGVGAGRVGSLARLAVIASAG